MAPWLISLFGQFADALAVAQHDDPVGAGLHLREPVGDVDDADAVAP